MKPIPNDYALSDLPTRIDFGWFFGFSYPFLDFGGQLQKPFAGVGQESN